MARDVARAQTGKTTDAARQVLREALVSAKEMSRGKFIDKMSTKGKPGDDSVNACLPDDRSRCKYAVFSKFLTMIDLLVSSGCPVDTIHDDFSAYYEMFALGEFDKWYLLSHDRKRWRIYPRTTLLVRDIQPPRRPEYD